MSPTRWVAALVWPLTWQSKQATPRRGPQRPAIVGQVELLLGERREQQAQTVELLGVEDVLEQLEEVVGGDQLSLRYVSQIGTGGQEDGRRKLRHHVIGQVEVQVEALEIPAGLALDLVDGRLGEDHAALVVVGMGQRQEALGEQILSLYVLGSHRRQLIEGHALGQQDAHTCLYRFAPGHEYVRRPIAQIVAGRQQGLLELLGDRTDHLSARENFVKVEVLVTGVG